MAFNNSGPDDGENISQTMATATILYSKYTIYWTDHFF